MSRKKKRPSQLNKSTGPRSEQSIRLRGLREFQAKKYDKAIAAWYSLKESDPALDKALAEAHFRHGLTQTNPDDQVADMQRAIDLTPNALRYRYHLGLSLHHQGKFEDAIACYRAVLTHQPDWPGAGMVLAIAELQRNPKVQLEKLPGYTPDIATKLAPVLELIKDPKTSGIIEYMTPATYQPEVLLRLWKGLAMLKEERYEQALAMLSDDRPLPSRRASAVRRYYQGMIAAPQQDDNNIGATLNNWHYAYGQGYQTSWLIENWNTILYYRLRALMDAGDMDLAVSTAKRASALPLTFLGLKELMIQVFDYAAHQAFEKQEWNEAISSWQQAREIASNTSSAGSPRIFLHNMALAYEAQDRWSEAADMWRAMLRTRSRQQPKGDQQDMHRLDVYTDERWAWVRKRIIHCYKQLGQPGEAVNIYKQAIKQDPNDLDMRLQLADALVANDQYQAAMNELQRILDRDKDNIDAHLRFARIYSEEGYWRDAERSLRRVLELQPEREDVRQEVARLINLRGDHYHRLRNYEHAKKAYEEGWTFDPKNYSFPVCLARVAVDQKNYEEAEALLSQALELIRDTDTDIHTFAYIIECWLHMNNVEAVLNVLHQAETTYPPTLEFYLSIATILLKYITPSANPFMEIFATPQATSVDDEKEDLWLPTIRDILDRAVALHPDTPSVYFQIASLIMTLRPDVARIYADQGVAAMPDNLAGQITLAIIMGLEGQKKEAKQILSRVIRQARKEGDTEMLQQAEDLRRSINSPFFESSMRMADIFDDMDMDMDFDDLYF